MSASGEAASWNKKKSSRRGGSQNGQVTELLTGDRVVGWILLAGGQAVQIPDVVGVGEIVAQGTFDGVNSACEISVQIVGIDRSDILGGAGLDRPGLLCAFDLAEVGDAGGVTSVPAGGDEVRQGDQGQQGDDGNHDHDLNQGEVSLAHDPMLLCCCPIHCSFASFTVHLAPTTINRSRGRAKTALEELIFNLRC